MKKYHLLALSLLILFVAACSGDSGGIVDPEPESATFEADVSGAVTASLAGRAGFGSDTHPETGESVFGVVLADEDEQGAIAIVRDSDTRPDTGTYALDGTEGFQAIYLHTPGGEFAGGFEATSGTLTIDASSSDRLEGSFTFEATGVLAANPEEEMEISVSGQFNAKDARITL